MALLKTIAPVIPSSDSSILDINNRIDSLSAVNKSVLQKNDSLISVINKLNEQIDYKQSILEHFDRLSSNYSIFIGALIGLFGLFSILSYFIAYKPLEKTKEEANRLLDDIKNNMDKLFSDFTKRSREELVDKALTNIENNITSEITNSINYLNANRHEGLNDKETIRVIRLIKRENRNTESLIRLLLYTDSIFTTEFFKDFIRVNSISNHLSIWVALYAAKYDKEEFLDDIAEYIIKSDELASFAASVRSESHDYLMKLFNNEKLVERISDESLKSFMSYHDNNTDERMRAETSKQKSDRQKTKLYQKYLDTETQD